MCPMNPVDKLLRHWARESPTRDALRTVDGHRLTWHQLAQQTEQADRAAKLTFLPVSRTIADIQRLISALRHDACVSLLNPRDPGNETWKRQLTATGLPSHLSRGTIIQTSGSSGARRGVLHTLDQHLTSAAGLRQRIPFTPGDAWLLTLPLYHAGGLAIVFRALLSGMTIVLSAKPATRVDLTTSGVTHASLVPTQLIAWLDEPATWSPHKLILLGGAGIPQTAWAQAIARGWPVAASYGSTEMASTITMTTPGNPNLSAGTILPHRELRIDHGRVLVRGPTLGRCYLPNQTPLAQIDDWFDTGDRGNWRHQALHILGRHDHLMISGGKNIHPEEVEQALLSLPTVKRACVVPIAHPTMGQCPVAFVDTSASIAPTDLAHLLPAYKTPRHIWPWPASQADRLKPDRAALAQLAQQRITTTL